jgi:hypothetical protein
MTASVFGACKFCPCGRNSMGCHVSYGVVYCKCKFGFTGDRCQDKGTKMFIYLFAIYELNICEFIYEYL